MKKSYICFCCIELNKNNIFISAVKRLIAINHIQNKIKIVYIIYVCKLCIFIMYIRI